ncbi:HAD family hydrolase [Candidatus Woesearchaeota archaeon]|nr:HAD family hydrolase [Candidatus Woesearchaeota archaeon]
MMPAIFMDRDGVVTEDIGYVHRIEDFKLIPNAIEGLKVLKDYKLFFITNQSGIGRGYYKLEDFFNYNKRVLDELKKNGISIAKTYYCPHKPDDNCDCRKPKIKLLKQAEEEFNVDLQKSFVIGDRKSDFEMGRDAGCRTIHVMTGYGSNAKNEVHPDYAARDLLDAAKWIIENFENGNKR